MSPAAYPLREVGSGGRYIGRLYGFHSEPVHKGLAMAYEGFGHSGLTGQRRILAAWFMESAILRYLESPRTSLIGDPATGADEMSIPPPARRFQMNRRVRAGRDTDRYRVRRTMSSYIVTYDLSAPGRNYDSLFGYLKSFPYAHVVESTWVISTYKTAVDVRDEILLHIDSNDHVLVIEATRNAAWFGLPAQVSNWLKKNLASAA
jgi:hypothetical protein